METINNTGLPEGYVRLEGSERRPSKDAKLIGPAGAAEIFKVTIVLRRRTDGPALPDFDYYAKTPPGKRTIPSQEEFAGKYGANPNDIKQIVSFAEKAGLKVEETHAGRRTVVISGTVAQMSSAFALKLGRYEHIISRSPRGKKHSAKEIYRGRDGFVNVPKDLAPIIIGVFGLDNRKVGHRAGGPADPAVTTTITVHQATQLYNFPNPGAAISEQTIGIIAPTGGFGGYLTSDLDLYFNSIGISAPNLYPIHVDNIPNGTVEQPTTAGAAAGQSTMTFASTAQILNESYGMFIVGGTYYYIYVTSISSPTTILVEVWSPALQQYVTTGLPVTVPANTKVYFNLDQETTQDVCISAAAAPGANVAVYFSTDTQAGWVDLINRVIQPNAGDFPAGVKPPSVLSASWSIAPGDDPDGLTFADDYWSTGITLNGMTAMDLAFQDAAIYGITVCIATGDRGANCGLSDAYVHVQPPASDPWVLAVGGTTIGKYQPATPGSPLAFEEYVWNDIFFGGEAGATGGGVSDYFPLPSYQNGAGVPNSLNLTINPGSTFNKTGRGIPDVAGNASPNSGYLIYLGASLATANGTSASTPLWAGLIAVINSNLGANLGFINSTLYQLGPGAFNHVNPLWPDPAYPQLAACPSDNAYNGVAGYPAHAGWDACTGLGSPNGNAILNAFQNLTLPKVYILGGYQSPNIIITDPSTVPPNQPVVIGGLPGGRWDTLLKPSSPYGFAAIVTNDSPVAANNVEVRFWAIPGGVGTNGSLVGTPQTVNIPAYSSLTVNASAPFVSAAAGDHLCAVVSLYNPSAGCTVQALNALEIPNPGASGSHGCSAWRNTDSMLAQPGGNFKFPLGLGKIAFNFQHPVVIQIQPVHIPFNWNQLTRVGEIENILRFVGAENSVPLYLAPEINRSFQSMHLKTKLAAAKGGKITEIEAGKWHILPVEREETSFEITGEIPKSARNGDIVLVTITANYPKTDRSAARSVLFYEFIHIADKIER